MAFIMHNKVGPLLCIKICVFCGSLLETLEILQELQRFLFLMEVLLSKTINTDIYIQLFNIHFSVCHGLFF